MQDVSGWPAPGGTTHHQAVRVTVGGVVRDPLTWEVDHSAEGGLPAQVVGGMGVTPATGTITFAPVAGDDPGRLVSPWEAGAWPPARDTPVTIEAGYGDALARVFTGKVDAISGGTDGAPLVVRVIDSSDRLRKRVLFPPIMSTGPRLDVTTLSSNFISPGLTAGFFLTRAAAWCGLHAIPPMVRDAVAYAPLSGSVWLQRGTLTLSERWGATRYDRWPWWGPAPWGQGPRNLRASILPGYGAAQSGRITATSQLKMSFHRGRPGAAGTVTQLVARWGSLYVSLRAYPNARADVVMFSGAATWTSQSVPLAEDETIVISLSLDGMCRLRTSAGVDVSSQLSMGPQMTDADMDTVDVWVPEDGPQIAAAQVWFGAGWEPLDFTRTAHLDHTSLEGTLQGTRLIDMTAIDLVSEIAQAEVGAAWLDSFGEFHFRNRRKLVAQEPVRTLTSLDDIYSYDWEFAADSVRSATVVTYTRVALGRNTRSMITLWQGSGEQIGAEPVEVIATPGGDEAWVAVDRGFFTPWSEFVGFPSNFNQGIGSWSFGSGGEGADEHYRRVDSTLEQIGPQAWKITSVTETTAEQKVPAEPNNYPSTPKRLHGENLPILRGRGRMFFHEERVESVATPGPEGAPSLTHDAGQWIQSEANASRLAEEVQAWVATPTPLVRGVRVHPDPRLELHDVVMVRDSHVLGRLVRLLVTGISVSGTADGFTMTLDGQVIATSPTTIQEA